MSQTPYIVIIEQGDGIPKLNTCVAIFVLILNIILPGWGTIFVGLMSGNCCGWFCQGVLQFFLAVILVGWIWSIITGCQILSRSRL